MPTSTRSRPCRRQAGVRDGDAADPDAAPVELEEFDLQQGTAELDEIDADPSYVGVIVAPGVDGDAAALDVDLPVVSLSGLGSGDGRQAWIRMVAPLVTVADALAARLRRAERLHLLGEPAAGSVVRAACRAPPRRQRANRRACRCGGRGSRGGVRHRDLGRRARRRRRSGAGDPAGRLAFIGGDRLLDPDFLSAAGTAAEGSFALCACANVSTSTELAARRFIQDYQSEHGVAPGAYAVEGWDAAHVILRALGEAGRPRKGRRVARMLTEVEGLEGTHRFGANGEPLEPRALLRLYRVEGGRWVRAAWEEI